MTDRSEDERHCLQRCAHELTEALNIAAMYVAWLTREPAEWQPIASKLKEQLARAIDAADCLRQDL